jgi:transketolase
MRKNKERLAELNKLCKTFRRDVLTTLHAIQTGHPGGSLSVCEILTALYFEKANISPENFSDPKRDRVILSKGHAAPMLYRILAEKGFFPVEEMSTLRQINSNLQGHPCPLDTKGVEVASGPLGIAFPAALGIAMGNKLSGCKDSYVYVILGDGEINEGIVWECAMSASKFNPGNFIAILDMNGVQLDGTTDEVMPLGDIPAKWSSFGWTVLECDGHDIAALCHVIDTAKGIKDSPVIICAHTVKGKGVSFMEGKNAWHGKAINDEEYAVAMKELGGDK